MALSKEMFGKRVQDLNKYEKYQYINSLKSVKLHNEKSRLEAELRGLYKKTFSYKYFGKRHRDLNEDEKREYNRVMKAKERERKKEIAHERDEI